MGMPVTVEVVGETARQQNIDEVFSYFGYIDEKFSTYKSTSEITRVNNGELEKAGWSEDMKTVFALSEETKVKTGGYFDITAPDGKYDPSGIVKGWAIYNAAKILESRGSRDFYIEAGGDIQVRGENKEGENWKIGIRNPFNPKEIVKAVSVKNEGVATSGSYVRGQHIYDPKARSEPITEIVSLTVIGPDIYEADRFATAAFAMREKGIEFIESFKGFEGYMIDKKGVAVMTSGFGKYAKSNA